MSATSTSTSPSNQTGTAVIALVTTDGSPIPDDTVVCLGDQCQALDGPAGATVVAGSTSIFDDLAPDTCPLTVFVGAALVYADSIEIVAGETTAITVTVDGAAPTVGPATPIGGTVVPGGGNDGGGSDPGEGGGQSQAPVTSLPSTGTGSDASRTIYLVLLSTALLAITGALATTRRRTD